MTGVAEQTARLGSRPSRTAMVITGLALLGNQTYWWACLRSLVLQGDDYNNATVAGHPYGRISAAEWLSSYAFDYTSLNGRLADAVVRLILAPGPWLWRMLGPLVFTLVVGLVMLWALTVVPASPSTRVGSAVRVGSATSATSAGGAVRGPAVPRRVGPVDVSVVAIGALAIFPVMIASKPGVAGDVLFWLSASVSYVVTMVFALVGGYVLGRIALGLPLSRVLAGLGFGAILVVHLMHEQGSTCMAALVIAAWIVTPARRRNRALLACTTASVVGLVAQAVAPGYRVRLAAFTGSPTEQGGNWVAQLANGTQALVDTGWAFLVAAVVLVVAAAWVRRRGPLMLAAGSAALVGGLGSWLLSRYRLRSEALRVLDVTQPFPSQRTAFLAYLVIALLLLTVVGLAVVAVAAAGDIGPAPALAVFAAMGGGAIPLVIGLLSFRSYFPTTLWLAVAAVSAGDSLLLAARGLPVAQGSPPGVAAGGDGVAQAHARVAALGSGVDVVGRTSRVPRRIARSLVACAVVLCVAASVRPLLVTPRATRANSATWEVTARQIAAAREGRCTQVAMPAAWPYPAYLYTNGIQSSRYADSVRRYYDLPLGVALVYGRAPADCASIASVS